MVHDLKAVAAPENFYWGSTGGARTSDGGAQIRPVRRWGGGAWGHCLPPAQAKVKILA